MASEEKQSKKKKSSSNIWVLLLGAGLLGFIGGIFGNFIEWRKEVQLTDKEFQYDLIKDVLSVQNSIERKDKVDLYYRTKLIKEDEIGLNVDTLVYLLGKQRGRADGAMAKGILGAVKNFYQSKKRVPYDLNELKAALNISNHLKYFNNDVHYEASAPKDFELRFFGADGVLYTDDDNVYLFKHLNIP